MAAKSALSVMTALLLHSCGETEVMSLVTLSALSSPVRMLDDELAAASARADERGYGS